MPKKKITSLKQSTKDIIADVIDIEGKAAGKIELPKEIFGAVVNKKLLAQAVRIYLANNRSGTRDTKTRSEVTGSTRKIYKQKGTGRARHGDIKAPIFIGGGVTHGPKPKDFSLAFPKKMKKRALFSALSDKFNNGAVKIVKDLKDLEQKTKNMVIVLKKLNLYEKLESNKGKILLITDGKRENLVFAGRNIKNFKVIPVSVINSYEVLIHNDLIFLKEAISKLTDIFLKVKENKDESRKVNRKKRDSKNDVIKTVESKAIKPRKVGKKT